MNIYISLYKENNSYNTHMNYIRVCVSIYIYKYIFAYPMALFWKFKMPPRIKLCLYFMCLTCSALQTKADVPGLERTLVACLERVFQTKYGACLIPHYMVCLFVYISTELEA